jgi:hypothetical protein
VLLVTVAVASAVTVVLLRSSSKPAPFSESWRTELPSRAPLAKDSSVLVRAFVRQYHEYYGAVGVNRLPIYLVGRSQPTIDVAVRAGCNDFHTDTGSRLPIPVGAVTTRTGDSPLVVFQPSTSTEWELWKAYPDHDGHWSACWGGKMSTSGDSVGVFPSPYGLSASGISYLATTITEADVHSGRIGHTLAVDVVDCNAPPSRPADRTDCSADPGEPTEGTMFRMPKNVPLPAGLTPFGVLVFRALQDYGMVVTDRAGAITIQAQSAPVRSAADRANTPSITVDPITASWQGKPEYEALSGIPWADMVALAPSGSIASR